MSIRFYPVQKSDFFCDDHDVMINGMPVIKDAALVSACPFNRRWPGHQRPADQTEPVNFINMEADEPFTVEVTPARPFEKAAVRPRDSVRDLRVEDGRITFTVDRPGYYTVEPYGRHNALHLFVDPPQTGDVPSGGDVIFFGPGVHEAGEIELHSGQTLFIDAGALVYATVFAHDAENITITGRGILDHSHQKEQILFEAYEDANDEAIDNAVRRHCIDLKHCTGVKIDGITVRDSLVYTIRPVCCKNVTIQNVKIIGNWRYNSDGIDMHNCEDVLIRDCFIRTFDDSICVKGFDYILDPADMYHNGVTYDSVRNVTVDGCTIWNDWGKCLEIGAETRAREISGILFENCSLIHAEGAVLDCMNVDYAVVHDLTYRNISVEIDEVMEPMRIQRTEQDRYVNTDPKWMPDLIRVEVTYHHEYSCKNGIRGINRDILFENISVWGAEKLPVCIRGFDAEHTCSGITIRGLRMNDEEVRSIDGWLTRNGYCDNIVFEGKPV